MITFISTYPPILCGIGSYLKYVTTHLSKFKIISFDFKGYKCASRKKEPNAKYIINMDNVEESAKKISKLSDDMLWFQHAHSMWDYNKFIQLLKLLKDKKKIVTFHNIHFQSKETRYGLEKREHRLLKNVMPLIDAATFFTSGAYKAASSAFPKYKNKFVLMRHGTHLYPKITRREAKHRLFEYLTKRAKISKKSKEGLKKLEKIFFKKRTKIVGDAGFITPTKAERFIFITGRALQNMLPKERIIVLRIGTVRDPKDKGQVKAKEIIKKYWADNKKSYLLECYLPDDLLGVALKAFTVIPIWPNYCTQSGRLAHAQGAGAAIVGKDLEGVGETLKKSKYFVARNYDVFLSKIKKVVLSQDIRKAMLKSGRAYARRFHFKVQAKKHLKLAKAVLKGKKLPRLDL